MRKDHGYRNQYDTKPKSAKSSDFYTGGKTIAPIEKGGSGRDGATKQGKTKGKLV